MKLWCAVIFVIIFFFAATYGYVANTGRTNPSVYFSKTNQTSAAVCEQLCASTTKCLTWYYDSAKLCYLKATLDAPTIVSNYESGSKAGMFVGDWGIDRPGNNSITVVLPATATALNCSLLCNANSVCKAWSFQTVEVTGNTTVCYLKDTVPTQSNSSNFISGLKSAKYGKCASVGSNWVKWSSYFGSTVHENATVVISDINIILDVSPPIVYNLTIVSGGLYFDPNFNPTAQNPVLSLKAYNIFVGLNGSLVVGCAAQQWNKPGEIVLYGRRSMYDASVLNVTPGRKVIAVQSGGYLQFVGRMDGLTWTKLGATAIAGSRQIVLVDAVSWTVGQKIVIASSDENSLNSEIATITAVAADKKTLNISIALKYRHWGQLWQSNGDAVDIRSEVGLLSRNIVITSDARNDTDSNINGTRFGGHIIMLPGSNAQLYGAEVTLMGQASFMARYPVHFHINGDSSYGSYIERLAIHDNYQRSLTIHYSNGVVVNDVVAYNTFGHMYFFEDGVEQHNTLTHNLGINALAPRSYDRLMVTDSTPAIFWITSPPNSWYNNSACGGTFGYWFSLPANSIGVAAAFNVSSFPQQSAIIAFVGNSAHSNSQFGLNIDEGITANPPCPTLPLGNADPLCGATARFVWQSRDIVVPVSYSPAQAAVVLANAPYKLSNFVNNTFWKIPGTGIWTRGSYHMIQNLMTADCAIHEKHPDGPGVISVNGVLVGRTDATSRTTQYGYTAYDAGGPNFAIGNRYYNFNGTNGAISGQSPHVRVGWDVHLQSHFFNSPNYYNGKAATYSAPDMILDDYDGSLTGYCGASIVNSSHLLTSDCVPTSNGYGYACPASPPRRRFYLTPYLQPGVNATMNPLQVLRIDNYGFENRTSELPTLEGIVTSPQNYYEFSIVSTGTYWVGVPGEPSPTNITITVSGMPNGTDYLNQSTPPEWVRMVWNYPAGTTFAIRDSISTINYTQVSSRSALAMHTYYFDSANEWLYVHFQSAVLDTYLMSQNYSMLNTQFNIYFRAFCPNGDCHAKNASHYPPKGYDAAPNGPRVRCGFRPTVSYTLNNSNTLKIAQNGTFSPLFTPPADAVFVSDPYGSANKVMRANLTNSRIYFAAKSANISLAAYNYLHFSIAVKGAGQRGLIVQLTTPGVSTYQVTITNPWFLPGGQTPTDSTGWVEVYIPIARFNINVTHSNISNIYFYPDGGKNNYYAYINNLYFANAKASYPNHIYFMLFYIILRFDKH